MHLKCSRVKLILEDIKTSLNINKNSPVIHVPCIASIKPGAKMIFWLVMFDAHACMIIFASRLSAPDSWRWDNYHSNKIKIMVTKYFSFYIIF